MDTGHNDLLGELAADAALERSDFIVQATEQLRRFLDHHKDRIAVLGGLTLIDDEPDYLSIAPDLSFRSRSRYLDDVTGEWVSETEVIESASELIELYNPADVYAAFAEAAREAAGMPAEPTAEGDLLEVSGISPEEGVSLGEDPYAAAADSWAAGQPPSLTEDDDESAARRLYDLALEYQERSQHSEARLLDEFEGLSAGLVSVIGDMIIVDDDDERLSLTASGFRAEVIPEDADDEWRTLSGADELVEFYDPTDVFGDLADALAEAFPAVAPELADATNGTGGGDEVAATEPAGRRRGRERRGRQRRGRRRRRRGRADRVTMRLAAAELVDSREILPGQWLQAYHAPAIAAGSRAGQFVHVRPGDFSGTILRRPFSLNTVDPATGTVTVHFRVIGRGPTGSPGCDRATRSTCSGRSAGRSRSTRAAATCCSSRAGSGSPACGCSPTRRSATVARSRSCSGRRRRARSIRPASCPTRSSTSWRPTTAASVTTAT